VHPREAGRALADRDERVAAVEQPPHTALADAAVRHRLDLEPRHQGLDGHRLAGAGLHAQQHVEPVAVQPLQQVGVQLGG
jgi:hypothetical protein